MPCFCMVDQAVAADFVSHHATQTLTINPAKRDIESFSWEDFKLDGYNPHKKIAMQMAV
jgi:thymidylate synthase